jgi:hypothetical protein
MKEGDLIEVRDSDLNTWQKRIFLFKTYDLKYVCVRKTYEDEYLRKDYSFRTICWEQGRKI